MITACRTATFCARARGTSIASGKSDALPKDTWLMNQHVEPMFRYSDQQMQRMKTELTKRSAALRQMTPWPDINYMVDESWARVYPYGQTAKEGTVVRVALRITNHAPRQMTYKTTWNVPAGWEVISDHTTATISPREDGAIEAQFRVSGPGLHVITADVSFGTWQLPAWTEALVRVQ